MPSLPFTLRQLEVFSTLCASRSFRRSADELGISQASVSNQIKTLEQQLGVALFLRSSGKRAELTAEGQAFLDDLTSFEAAAQNLASHRRRGAPREERLSLRIRAGLGLVDHYIRPKLDRFLIDHPDIDLDFVTELPSELVGSDVDCLKHDFALLHQREDHQVGPMFREIALLRGGIYGHRSFAEGHDLPLSAEHVGALPFILPSEGSLQEKEVYRALRRAGIVARKVVCHTQYFDVIAKMLGQGLGVASFAEVILPPAMRESVILLHPLNNWRLIWYRRGSAYDERYDIVEEFLLSSLLKDPNYPAIELFDGQYAPPLLGRGRDA